MLIVNGRQCQWFSPGDDIVKKDRYTGPLPSQAIHSSPLFLHHRISVLSLTEFSFEILFQPRFLSAHYNGEETELRHAGAERSNC